jgi:hypothetical protein
MKEYLFAGIALCIIAYAMNAGWIPRPNAIEAANKPQIVEEAAAPISSGTTTAPPGAEAPMSPTTEAVVPAVPPAIVPDTANAAAPPASTPATAPVVKPTSAQSSVHAKTAKGH